jgi:glutathione S-transferase
MLALTLWHIYRVPDQPAMTNQQQIYPVLWSFRRCPYAMRARLAIAASRSRVWLREILLRDKPDAFIAASPKATVPALALPDGTVIEESRDIMIWALQNSDPQGWLSVWQNDQAFCTWFLDHLDGPFKQHLDHYKYASRFAAEVGEESRQMGAEFLAEIDQILAAGSGFLSGAGFGLLDAATLPFVRQFRGVDANWFDRRDWSALNHWLDMFLASENFATMMQKYPPWHVGDSELLFPA